MADIPNQRRPVVLNPGGGALQLDDVDSFLAGYPQDQEPMIDLGGGMVVPLQELADDAFDEDDEELP